MNTSSFKKEVATRIDLSGPSAATGGAVQMRSGAIAWRDWMSARSASYASIRRFPRTYLLMIGSRLLGSS